MSFRGPSSLANKPNFNLMSKTLQQTHAVMPPWPPSMAMSAFIRSTSAMTDCSTASGFGSKDARGTRRSFSGVCSTPAKADAQIWCQIGLQFTSSYFPILWHMSYTSWGRKTTWLHRDPNGKKTSYIQYISIHCKHQSSLAGLQSLPFRLNSL